MARESLKRLKQARTVRDYVKEFSSLILDIKDMSEVDKLFNFMSGLQGWAQTKLRSQGMWDLPSAIMAVDCLVDYQLDASSFASQKGKGQQQQRQSKKVNPKTLRRMEIRKETRVRQLQPTGKEVQHGTNNQGIGLFHL